ncbi:MAG: hypothetical protein ACKOTZ_03675 [Chloroflexota bacterium]
MPATRFVGDWLMRVQSGVITVTLVDGSAGLWSATGSGDDLVDLGVDGAVDRPIGAGQVLWAGPDAVLTLENRGTDPTVVLSTVVTRGQDVVILPVDPDASPGAAFRDPVVKRIVLSGPGRSGDRFRITVADRSGRVIGARLPSASELRFAGGGDLDGDVRELDIGPVADLDRGTRELLVQWGGTPCGPVVTLDVARELDAIRLVDRTPGCDASGVGYAVVLRIRGRVPAPTEIEVSRVRR